MRTIHMMLAEVETDRLAGVVLGGAYQLVGRIGEGGMGAVYEAHHLRLQKRVAVKLMNRAMLRYPDALERFHREAMVASRLGHPHLVNVLDFGASDQGEPYIVMEYLEGEDLERRIRRAGSVPLKTAVRIARQVASALAVVHAKGIVHRDLKPANVFLVQVPGEPDFVKVLDFGVSKIKAARTRLTDTATVIGTPEYMSPEQASTGVDIDHRADQWALACIVWEMLSGRTPFRADDSEAVFYQLTHAPPPSLSTCAPGISSGVESALRRALSKRAVDRYSSMREFARALEMAALGSWSELTPMPFRPAEVAALCEAAASPAVELANVGTLAPAVVGEARASSGAHPEKHRVPGFRPLLAGLGILMMIAVGSVFFARARGKDAVAKVVPQASAIGSPAALAAPVAPGKPVVKVIARERNEVTAEPAVAAASSPRRPNKILKLRATAHPFHGAVPRSRTGLQRKANPFTSPLQSHGRRSRSRHDETVSHPSARPANARLLFEEL